MLPRHLHPLRQDRLGRLRTACRRGHAHRARRRSLHVQPGRLAGPGAALGFAVAVPSLIPARSPSVGEPAAPGSVFGQWRLSWQGCGNPHPRVWEFGGKLQGTRRYPFLAFEA